MMFLLFLTACERDPTLFGYWDIVAMRAGATDDNIDEVTQAGFIEFTDAQLAVTMYSYVWAGDAWAPDRTPDLREYTTDLYPSDDFVGSYREKGETYAVEFYEDGRTWTFRIDDWAGSSVTLSAAEGFPPGARAAPMIFELDLER